MKINIVTNPKAGDFIPSVDLLNKIFSKLPGSAGKYDSSTAFKKTKGKDAAIFEVIDNNELVGFAIGYKRYEGYYHIWQLGVDENFRERGVAASIYERIEEYAHKNGYNGVTLNTFNRYVSNIRLIVGRGYKIYDLDKTGEHKGDPKILFKKEFSSKF